MIVRLKHVIPLFILIVFTTICKAQPSDLYDQYLQKKIYYEVKQLSQFFERFNMSDTVRIDSLSLSQCQINILSLFDMQKYNFATDSIVWEFTNYICESGVRIGYENQDWYSTATAVFQENNAERKIELTLSHVRDTSGYYKWIIAGINPTSLLLSEKVSDIAISPLNNEINFIDLSKAFSGKKNLSSYTSSTFTPDYLSIFLSLVERNILKFVQIENVTYHLLQIDGWLLKIQFQNRIDFNSGWLITDIVKMSKEDKNIYRVQFLNLKSELQ